jgi:hypothetical protein
MSGLAPRAPGGSVRPRRHGALLGGPSTSPLGVTLGAFA